MKPSCGFLRAVPGLAVALSAHAQLSLSAGSVSTLGKPLSMDCQLEAKTFVDITKDYPLPKIWNVVIVCDDSSWTVLLEHMTKDGAIKDPQNIDATYGETDINHNITFIRGVKLAKPDLGVTPEHIVTHELAHAYLHTKDEDKVDTQAVKWMKEQTEHPGSLAAGQTGWIAATYFPLK